MASLKFDPTARPLLFQCPPRRILFHCLLWVSSHARLSPFFEGPCTRWRWRCSCSRKRNAQILQFGSGLSFFLVVCHRPHRRRRHRPHRRRRRRHRHQPLKVFHCRAHFSPQARLCRSNNLINHRHNFSIREHCDLASEDGEGKAWSREKDKTLKKRDSQFFFYFAWWLKIFKGSVWDLGHHCKEILCPTADYF